MANTQVLNSLQDEDVETVLDLAAEHPGLFRLQRMEAMIDAGLDVGAAARASNAAPTDLVAAFAEIGRHVGVDLLMERMVSPALDILQGEELDSWADAALHWLRSVAASDATLREGRMAVVVRAAEPIGGLSPVAAAAVLSDAGWEVLALPEGTSLKQAAMQVRPDQGILVLAADTCEGALEGENAAMEVSHRTPVVTVGRGFVQVESERLLAGPGSWEELPWEAERSLAFWDIPG